jgi:hypothetical protein
LPVEVAKNSVSGRHGLPSARIGDTGDRVDENAALVYDSDLQAIFGSRRDHLVDHVLHLLLQVHRAAHPGKRHVVWLEVAPLQNPRPRTGRTRNTSARPPAS